MKKVLSLLLSVLLVVSVFAGCSSNESSDAPSTDAPASDAAPSEDAPSEDAAPSQDGADLVSITVGATPTPHAEILNFAKDLLKEKGVDLTVQEFTDYVRPNMALESSELDANFFQHKPYLDNFNEENKTSLVSIGAIHYEPMGIFAGKTAALADLADGAKVSVPNDATNEARALLLLEAQGLIKLNPEAGVQATKNDITENPKNLDIVELEAAQLARSLPDVDISVINGNYAIQAGLSLADALATEAADSLSAETYANIIAVRAGDEQREELNALVEVLKGDEVKAFINETYAGAVVPAA